MPRLVLGGRMRLSTAVLLAVFTVTLLTYLFAPIPESIVRQRATTGTSQQDVVPQETAEPSDTVAPSETTTAAPTVPATPPGPAATPTQTSNLPGGRDTAPPGAPATEVPVTPVPTATP
jgi:hypothetical protein